jgi:hypothetical protein
MIWSVYNLSKQRLSLLPSIQAASSSVMIVNVDMFLPSSNVLKF